MYVHDTIAALATPPGAGGIAVIRLSGPDAERIAKELFVPTRSTTHAFVSHKLYHGHICEPHTGIVHDEVLIALMRGPHSYTGEDTVEIQCHGSPFVVRSVLRLVLAHGARHARRGEFTERAFLNGRLDLAQAEGVLELVQANSEKAAKIALGQLEGGLSIIVQALRESLMNMLVQVEAAIDFPEEEIELANRRELERQMEAVADKIEGLLASYHWGKLIREGVRICIVGRPNVGKSSLLNALLGEQRAIVTEVPGTTRDFIEESVSLDGLPVVLWDTAGIRRDADGIERMGIDRSWDKIHESDGVLVVLDGSLPITAADRHIMEAVREKKGLAVINKADLPQRCALTEIRASLPSWPQVAVSAIKYEGLAALRHSLRGCFVDSSKEPELIVTNVRHKAALERAAQSVGEAKAALKQGIPPEMIAVDLQGARDSLEEIIGTVTNDEVLDRIFSQFCIGK